ncbi:MAG: hypothetical protein ACKVPX_14360 [Myxococcaceae bacterium]
MFRASALSLMLLAVACTKTEPITYQGPGSYWQMTMNPDGGFTTTRAPDVGLPAELTVSGSYSQRPSGFIRYTVESASGSEAPVPGAAAWGLNIPGYVLLVQPDENNGQIIPMLVSGECPASAITLNWVKASAQGSSGSANEELFGVATLASSGAPTLSMRRALTPGFPEVLGGGDNTTATGCSNGVLTLQNPSENIRVFLTASGGAIVDTPNGAVIATPQASISASALVADYIGFVFADDSPDGSQIPASATATLSGASLSVTANVVTNRDTGATDATRYAQLTLNTFNAFSTNGLITGSAVIHSPDLSDGMTSGQSVMLNVACNGIPNVIGSGKNMLFCVSQGFSNSGATTAPPSKPFSMLFVSR